MSSCEILAESVVKTYGGGDRQPAVSVLGGVSLEVTKGQFVALMGSSGSGKTTLLNLIGGLDTPDSGHIKVAGSDIQGLPDRERSEFRLRNVGFVFQFFNLLPNLTVVENIAMPLLFLGEKNAAAKDKARAYATEVGLGDKTERMVHQLSGGEMQRVGLARAMVHQPRVLLADEPTGNLDSKTGVVILDLIRNSARNHGLTVLMATHDQKAADHCDRVVRMSDGRVVGE